MFTSTQIHPRSTSATTPPRHWLYLLVIPGLLLMTAAAVRGQAENVRRAEPALTLVETSLNFDPAKATAVRTLGGKDPAKLPSPGGVKQPTPGWTTIVYETSEGNFPDDNGWVVQDNDSSSGLDYWDDVSCRSFAGSWSVWCADVGDQSDCVNYDDDMSSWMIMGPFSLADAVDARAEFRVWSQTEAPEMPFDFVSWGASTNGTDYFGSRLATNTNGWQLETFDFKNVPTLGDLRGDSSVWFAFVFTSDDSINNFEGTYLDEIVIEKLTGGGGSSCTPDATTLCIDNSLNPGDRRFKVTVSFQTTQGGGRMGDAVAIPLTAVNITKGGLFAFSDPQNPEILVKVLNGCNGANPFFWVIYAPTTNFGFNLTVEDTLKHQSKTYTNPDRNVASSVADLRALATCP